ncbi:MAG: hypothetical protein R6X15_07270, partial [Pseudomonadota bacterium]
MKIPRLLHRTIFPASALLATAMLSACGGSSSSSSSGSVGVPPPVGAVSLSSGSFTKSIEGSGGAYGYGLFGVVPSLDTMFLLRSSDIKASGNISSLKLKLSAPLETAIS